MRRIIGPLALMALLQGCTLENVPVIDAIVPKPAPARMAVAGGRVVIGGPSGYCVDPGESHDGAEAAFVLLGSCASISGSFRALMPKKPGILTASVSAEETDQVAFEASFPPMAAFLSSKAGRAALSRAGKAESVRILSVTSEGGIIYVHAEDRASAPGQSLDPDYWRALMVVNGRIVTLSVLALTDRPLEASAKRALLDGFVRQVRAIN